MIILLTKMSNFIKRQIDTMAKFSQVSLDRGEKECPILITRPFYIDANDESPAAKYVKSETLEYYHMASDQYTVQPYTDESSLTDILTQEGLKLLNDTQELYDRSGWKDVLGKYGTEIANSGFWSPDKESRYYENDCTCLNSWHNLLVTGYSQSLRHFITTSPIIFITTQWCLTKNGSLYKLEGEKLPIQEIYVLVNTHELNNN